MIGSSEERSTWSTGRQAVITSPPLGPSTGLAISAATGVRPARLLGSVAARVAAARDQVLPEGADMHEYAVLLALAGGEPRSQQWLADAVGLSPTTMAKLALGLVNREEVTRVRKPGNRRCYALTRTQGGAMATRRWSQRAQTLERQLIEGWAPAEVSELRALLWSVAQPRISSATPAALREHIGFLVVRVHTMTHLLLTSSLMPVGLKVRHVDALSALRWGGPVAQSGLARSLGTSGATVVEIVDHLESRRLIARRRPPHDRRTHVLHLLPAAGPLLELATIAVTQTVDAVLDPLSARRRRRLETLLERVVADGPAPSPAVPCTSGTGPLD